MITVHGTQQINLIVTHKVGRQEGSFLKGFLDGRLRLKFYTRSKKNTPDKPDILKYKEVYGHRFRRKGL